MNPVLNPSFPLSALLVQLSDPHIREPGRLAYGRIDTAPFLAAAVAAIGRLRQVPDAVVITGDLTDFGRPEEYAHLAHLLAPLAMPVVLMPGNHDDRQQLRSSFPQHSYLGTAGFVQYSVPVGGLQLIALDSTQPGKSHGVLCQERLDWLETELQKNQHKPVIVALHHPPFATLIGHMDAIGLLEGSQALAALLRRFTNIERVISGHLHRAISTRFGGTIAGTAPSTAHQVCLDLAADAASAWTLEPPGYLIHALNAHGGLVTHQASTGIFAGPFPFHDASGLID